MYYYLPLIIMINICRCNYVCAMLARLTIRLTTWILLRGRALILKQKFAAYLGLWLEGKPQPLRNVCYFLKKMIVNLTPFGITFRKDVKPFKRIYC